MTKRIQAIGDGRSRARSAGLLVVAFATLGLGVAGCSSSATSSPTPPPAAQGGGGSTDATQAVQYSQCMRKNGVPSFPDPVNGKLQLQVTKGGPLDPSSPQFQTAQQACKALEPPGLQTGGQSTQQQSQMLKFVSCMRTNGVPNFPDPQSGHFLVSGGIDPNSPQFKTAMQKCQKLLPGGGVAAGGQ